MNKIGMSVLALVIAAGLLAGGGPARAQTWQKTAGTAYTYTYASFEESAPEDIADALAREGLDPGSVVCGAVRRTDGGEKTAAPFHEIALLAVERGGERTLVGAWRPDGEWRIQDLGAKLLKQDRAFRILFKEGIGEPVYVEYAGDVTERYGFWQGFSETELWTLAQYQREAANGDGCQIALEYGEGGFRISAIDAGWGEGESHPVNWIGWTAYMDGLPDFPTTPEAARALAESSWAGMDGTDLCMLYGSVNLRAKPTGSSPSLGRYDAGTLAHRLGELPGRDAPWVHVRVGDTEGYVSGIYVRMPRTAGYCEALWHSPLPLARADAPAALRAQPALGAQEKARLDAGALMQVMGRTEDGWLHVSVPQGTPGWEMDADAPSGYVRADEMTQGTAASLALD